jgi:hypothetical protein
LPIKVSTLVQPTSVEPSPLAALTFWPSRVGNPCSQIDTFQRGLLRAILGKGANGEVVRNTGVMTILLKGGVVVPGDHIGIQFPHPPLLPLDVVWRNGLFRSILTSAFERAAPNITNDPLHWRYPFLRSARPTPRQPPFSSMVEHDNALIRNMRPSRPMTRSGTWETLCWQERAIVQSCLPG